MARSVTEWIGADDDARPPRSVKARVFARFEGRCHITGQKIRPGDDWELEHVKPVSMTPKGENWNRESNLAPALKAPHAEKSAAEAGDRAKADRNHAKHFGYYPKSRTPLKSRGFAPTRPRAERRA